MSDRVSGDPWAGRRAALARNWWALVIRGAIAVAFGVAALVAPGLVAAVLVVVFGAYALVDGVFAIVAAVLAIGRHERWGLLLVEGVAGLAIGIAAWVFPVLTIELFVTLLAVWAVFSGGLMLAAAFQLDTGHGNWLMGLGGLVSILWGVLLWAWPIAGAWVLTIWFGAYALLFGTAMIALGLRLRARRHTT